jgi:hypothetical protein
MTAINDETYLNDVWCFYFHDPYDTNWTTDSYKMLGTLSTVQEYWQHQSCIKEHISKGMFFIMREYVQPTWDDPTNINGGCLSLKVLKEQVAEFWEDICVKLLGETLLTEDHRSKWEKVNGISSSPKKHFCIIKIWLKDNSMCDKSFFDMLHGYYGDVLYKSNRENIHQDQSKVRV